MFFYTVFKIGILIKSKKIRTFRDSHANSCASTVITNATCSIVEQTITCRPILDDIWERSISVNDAGNNSSPKETFITLSETHEWFLLLLIARRQTTKICKILVDIKINIHFSKWLLTSSFHRKVYPRVAHTKNNFFAVYLKRNLSTNDCVWCNY